MDTPADLRFTDRADQALSSIHRLVVPTDVPGVDCVDLARRVARTAAAQRRFEVVLYDRSAETWMDHPHPSGPFRASELSDDFDVLAAQLRELEAAGIDATGWISTVPSLAEIAAAVEQVDADAVLLPQPSCDRTLVDRLTGSRDPDVNPNVEVARAVERDTSRPVVVLAIEDGQVDVLAPGVAPDGIADRPST